MNEQLEIFYNTTNLVDPELKTRRIRAGCLNAKILKFFQDNPNRILIPPEVYLELIMSKDISVLIPLTSIRRAMTTLTKLGYLEKTRVKKKGDYDFDNYCWRLNC